MPAESQYIRSAPWVADYHRVLDAGWRYNRERRCWYHAESNSWAACRQGALLQHILTGTLIPLRDMPLTDAERTERQTNGQFTVDQDGYTRPLTEINSAGVLRPVRRPNIVLDPRPVRGHYAIDIDTPAAVRTLAWRNRQQAAPPQAASGKVRHPITNKAWEA